MSFKLWLLFALAVLGIAVVFDDQSKDHTKKPTETITNDSPFKTANPAMPVQVKDMFEVFPPPVVARDRKFEVKTYDGFTRQTWAKPSPVPPKATVSQQTVSFQSTTSSEPTVPSIPFKYLGAMDHPNGAQTIYLVRNEELINVAAGSVIDGLWRIEKLTDLELQMTYLPSATLVRLSRE